MQSRLKLKLKIILAADRVLKLFQNYFQRHWKCW